MSDEHMIEGMLIAKGLNAPRLTPVDIDKVILGETFTVLPSGKCMVCELTLENGFTVRGESACVSVKNFDISIGMKISRKDARDKVWMLEGYLLQQYLHVTDACQVCQNKLCETCEHNKFMGGEGSNG